MILLTRKELYNDIWTDTLSKTALKYQLSTAQLKKICNSLNIPTPSGGYWTKLRLGRNPERTPLPDNFDKDYIEIGMAEETHPLANEAMDEIGTKAESEDALKAESDNYVFDKENKLSFINLERRLAVEKICSNALAQAQKIKYTDEPSNKIAQQEKKLAIKWFKLNKIGEKSKISLQSYEAQSHYCLDHYISNPETRNLAEYIGEDSLNRVISLLDIIYNALVKVGGTPKIGCLVSVDNEIVDFLVTEKQDQIDHELTAKEVKELETYDKEKLKYSYRSKPRIRKYDHIFNGKLRFSIGAKIFSDHRNIKLEDIIDEIIIEFIYFSHYKTTVHNDIIAEEERRKQKAIKDEELRVIYNDEAEKFNALVNIANDWKTAQTIREFLNFIASSKDNVKFPQEWIEWGLKKADWIDPLSDREDEVFGKRKHADSNEKKALKNKERSYYGW